MTSELQLTPKRMDRNASNSLTAGLLALVAVCGAIIPVPFTGYICFPATAILAVLASVHGVLGLRRSHSLSRAEKGMALTGLTAGVGAVLVTACSAAIVVVLGLRLIQAIPPISP